MAAPRRLKDMAARVATGHAARRLDCAPAPPGQPATESAAPGRTAAPRRTTTERCSLPPATARPATTGTPASPPTTTSAIPRKPAHKCVTPSSTATAALLGFAAAAWKLAPRDRFIGWPDPTRQRHLDRIVNNTRLLTAQPRLASVQATRPSTPRGLAQPLPCHPRVDRSKHPASPAPSTKPPDGSMSPLKARTPRHPPTIPPAQKTHLAKTDKKKLATPPQLLIQPAHTHMTGERLPSD